MDATAARRNKVSNDRDAGVPSSPEALLPGRRTSKGRSSSSRVPASTSHGISKVKLWLPDQISSSAPNRPPSTLGPSSSHAQRTTRASSARLTHADVTYAGNKATALVPSATTGGKTKVSKGNVSSPPPPANALIAPATIAARKNNM